MFILWYEEFDDWVMRFSAFGEASCRANVIRCNDSITSAFEWKTEELFILTNLGQLYLAEPRFLHIKKEPIPSNLKARFGQAHVAVD